MRKKILILVGFLSVLGLVVFGFGGEGSNGTLINPYDVFDETHRIRNVANGTANDSILVHNDATDYVRRIAPIGTIIANYMMSSTVYNNAPSRSLVSTIGSAGYQISTTKNARVAYTVSHTNTLTLVQLTAVAKTYLEISPNNTTWTTINSAGLNRNVSIAVVITESSDLNVSGEVPAGWYVRLRTANTGGGSTTYLSGQEVTY